MEDVKFSVKFKGKVYHDVKKDKLGHLWFNGNQYEYVPKSRYAQEHVVIHGFKETSTGYESTCKNSYARVEIIEEVNK